ncbi:MAG: hypothetical protein RL708_720 [Bacteroidota bacterium]|jgi:PAS domain S-box-containing protein
MTQLIIDQQLSVFLHQFPSAVNIYQYKNKSDGGFNDYQCIYVNTKAVDLFQISEQDFLTKSMFEIFPMHTVSSSYGKIEQVMQTGIPETYEYKRLDKDVWYQVSLSKYKDGFIALTTDITEKKESEIQLKTANELLLLSNWRINNIDGTVQFDNLFFDKIIEEQPFQISLSDFINTYVHADDIEPSLIQLHQITKEDKWQNFERILSLKNGKKKYVDVFAKPIFANGECVAIYGTIRDITERKMYELSIQEKDNRIADAMQILNMTNWEIDLKTNSVIYEPSFFLNVLEEPIHRVLDVSEMINYIHKDDRAMIVNKIENAVKKENWETVEYKIELRNGKTKHVECFCKRKMENNICIGIYGTIRDITEKKIIELGLIEKQYQLQLSNELQQMGIMEYYPATETYKLSQPIQKILEEDLPEEISADEYFSYVQDNDITALRKRINKDIALHQPVKEIRKIKLKNGKIKYVEIVCLPHIENEKLIKYNGTFRDITEQKQLEKNLIENEQRLTQANNISNTGTWEYFIQQNLIKVSDELKLIYEADFENSLTIEEYLSFLYDDDRKKVADFLKMNIENKAGFEAIRKIKLKSGATKYIELKAKPIIEDNVLVKYIGTITDITQKRIEELSLQTSEARFRLFFEHNPIMYFIVDSQGIILSVNNFGLSHLGYSRDELIHQHVLKVFHEDDKTKAQQHLVDVLTSKENLNQWELRKIKKSGEIIWVKETAKATYDVDGNIMFLILCEDITDEVSNRDFLKQKHEELKLQKNVAEILANEKQQFASIISHEIRTPLNAVIGLANLLLIDNPTLSQAENLNTLKFSAENLMLLVNDILDFSKIESGNFKIEKIPFNLSHIINGIHQTFIGKANEKNLTLTTIIDPKIPAAIIGDPVRLLQVMNNLITNALKFTNYGQININVKRRELISPSEVVIRFEVTDTGIGISNEKQAKIFDMFSQTDAETSRRYGGTGLGLSITKKIVSLFNSKIYVESEPGTGSTFYFDVNFKIAEELSNLDNDWNINANTKRTLEGLNVLLVEDNVFNQMVIMKFLDKWKMNVDVANNGFEAIDKTKRSSDYDIILMDMHMPEMNGIDTTIEIRKSKNIFWQRIPIIALTADAINFNKEDLKKQGIIDVVFKPFDPVDLFKKLIQHTSIFED